QAMIGRGKDKDASKALVSRLLRNSEDSEIRQKLIRYCHVNFGTGRLNDLTRAQLQMALSWLDQQTQINPSSQGDSISSQFSFTTLFKSYPKEFIAVFVVGLLLGALIF
ncbi:hypothetical protein ACVXJ1_27180, partial [Klebsiella pneumoniae]